MKQPETNSVQFCLFSAYTAYKCTSTLFIAPSWTYPNVTIITVARFQCIIRYFIVISALLMVSLHCLTGISKQCPDNETEACFVFWCIIHSGKTGPLIRALGECDLSFSDQELWTEWGFSLPVFDWVFKQQVGLGSSPSSAVLDEVAYCSSQFHLRASMWLQRSWNADSCVFRLISSP